MKNKLLEDEKLLNTIVNKIASIIGDIDKRSVENNWMNLMKIQHVKLSLDL